MIIVSFVKVMFLHLSLIHLEQDETGNCMQANASITAPHQSKNWSELCTERAATQGDKLSLITFIIQNEAQPSVQSLVWQPAMCMKMGRFRIQYFNTELCL